MTRTSRRAASRSLACDDDGFTLIEVVVALAMVVLVFAALAAALITNQVGQRTANATSASTQVAFSTLNKAVNSGWANIGFYGNDPGLATTGTNNEPTVVLAMTAPSPRPAAVPLPIESTTVAGIIYTSTVVITWVKDAANSANPPSYPTAPTYGYKRVIVTVSYSLSGRAKSVVEQKLVAPTPADVAPPGTGGSTGGGCDTGTTTPFCGVDVTDGYISTSAAAATITTAQPLGITAYFTVQPDSVTVTYPSGGGNTTVVTLTASPNQPRTWTGSIDTASTVSSGSQTVVFKAVTGSTTATQNATVNWKTGAV